MAARALAPGAEAVLTVTILADSIFGPYRKSVFVETADPQHRVLQFTVTGDALPLVDVQPKRELNAGRLALGQEWRQTFTLTCTNPADTLGPPKLDTNYPAEASIARRGSAPSPAGGPSARPSDSQSLPEYEQGRSGTRSASRTSLHGGADSAAAAAAPESATLATVSADGLPRPAQPAAATGPSPDRGPAAAGVGPAEGWVREGPMALPGQGRGDGVPVGPAYELLLRMAPGEAEGDWRCVVVVPVVRGGREVGVARVAVTAQVGAMLVAVPSVVALPGVAEGAAAVRFGLRVMGGGAGQVRAEDVTVVAEWPPVRGAAIAGAGAGQAAAPGQALVSRAAAVTGGLDVEVELAPEVLRRVQAGEGLVLVCTVPGASPARVPCQPPR